MRILLAAPRGFCAGVNMAIESLRLAVDQFGAPIYVYHEIVHNRWVVERFRGEGVVFVDDLDEVPQGAHLLYSAHGVSPEVREKARQRGLRTIDATCPLVTKLHAEASRFARGGYRIILVGHPGHDEVVGVMGEAPEAIRLIEREEDIDGLEVANPERLAYLTQTTLSVDEAERIIARLKARFPEIVGPKAQGICYATQNRQEAVKQFAGRSDFALVVGSQNSSNSRRLAELCETSGVPTRLVDGPDDIDTSWFQGEETILLTAGASAPEDIVEACVALLVNRFGAEVEHGQARTEDVRFLLPKELRGRKEERRGS